MCMNPYAQTRKWNWEGDWIVQDPVVPSHRPIPGHRQKKRKPGQKAGPSYLIDPREFLVTEDNAVLRRCLREEIQPFSRDVGKFTSRTRGGFDFRADVITRWVGDHIELHADRNDIWQFPDETLHVRRGDCEDRAVLLAGLLIASGISAYNVRVAVGDLLFHRFGQTQEEVVKRDHAWVVYRRENGAWQILEPMESTTRRSARPSVPAKRSAKSLYGARISYEPTFVWNNDHLWQVARPLEGSSRDAVAPTDMDDRGFFDTELRLRRKWERLEPEFSGDVHHTLLREAVGDYGPSVVEQLQRGFTQLLGSYIDWPDMPWRYDPRDHFDNCMIVESWERAEARLRVFADKKRPKEDRLEAFSLAAHTISDFYAHTSYPWFANTTKYGTKTGYVLFDPEWARTGVPKTAARTIDYDASKFGLRNPKFTTGPRWNKSIDHALAKFGGRILSGRYAHESDSQSFFERFTWMPDDVWKSKDMVWAAAAPHHEEIAVDQSSGSNELYSEEEFPAEFSRRYVTAVEHVRREFVKVWGPAPKKP